MKEFIKDVLLCRSERDGANPFADILGGVFYITLLVSLGSGGIEAGKEDHCTIERVAELHPGYITGCVLFGKSLPGFKIFGG